MKKIKVIAKHSRPLNLLAIALLQVMLYFFVIYLPYQDLDLPWRLSPLDLSLMGIDLLIITAAGYLINDIFDRQTDQWKEHLHCAQRICLKREIPKNH